MFVKDEETACVHLEHPAHRPVLRPCSSDGINLTVQTVGSAVPASALHIKSLRQCGSNDLLIDKPALKSRKDGRTDGHKSNE